MAKRKQKLDPRITEYLADISPYEVTITPPSKRRGEGWGVSVWIGGGGTCTGASTYQEAVKVALRIIKEYHLKAVRGLVHQRLLNEETDAARERAWARVNDEMKKPDKHRKRLAYSSRRFY